MPFGVIPCQGGALLPITYVHTLSEQSFLAEPGGAGFPVLVQFRIASTLFADDVVPLASSGEDHQQ